MKYLAILKDSLREALDSKLLYFTLSLSLIAVFFVASTTMTPVTMKEEVESFLTLASMITSSKHPAAQEFGLAKFETVEIEDFKRLDEETSPWIAGKYQFTLVGNLWVEDPGKNNTYQIERIQAWLHQTARWFPVLELKQIDSNSPKQARFAVTAEGLINSHRSRGSWYHQPGLLFGLVKIPVRVLTLQQQVSFVCNYLIGTFGGAVTMLLSTIITAFFLPNMLSKGTVDLLLAKPINRVTLFLYKFMGGMTFMVVNTTVIMLGVYLGVGLQTGIWVQSFLLCIPIYTFQFAIFYSLSALVGVLWRSAILSMLCAVVLWVVLALNGWAYWIAVEGPRTEEQNLPVAAAKQEELHWATTILEVIHAVLPRYKELDWLLAKSIKRELVSGPPSGQDARPIPGPGRLKGAEPDIEKQLDREFGAYSWWAALGVSSLFIAVMVGLAATWFAFKDY